MSTRQRSASRPDSVSALPTSSNSALRLRRSRLGWGSPARAKRSVFALALIPSTLGLAVFVYGARGAWAPPPPGAWRPMARSRSLRAVAFLFGITFGVLKTTLLRV